MQRVSAVGNGEYQHLRLKGGKSGKDGESSKVEGAAAVEVVRKCREYSVSLFAWAVGESCSSCGWQKGGGKWDSPGWFGVRSCVLAHTRGV